MSTSTLPARPARLLVGVLCGLVALAPAVFAETTAKPKPIKKKRMTT
jgi:hypothetical protein